MKYLVPLTIIAFGSCALWLNLGCHKESDCPPDLPCATQTGANTFGCYINGKPWVAEIAPYVLDPGAHKIEASYDEAGYGINYGRFLSVSGRRTNDSTDGFIAINLKPITGTGAASHVNALTFIISAVITKTEHGQFVSAIGFELDTLFDYNIEITRLDAERNIVSGMFSFTGTSPADTVRVTDGRFDVTYDPY